MDRVLIECFPGVITYNLVIIFILGSISLIKTELSIHFTSDLKKEWTFDYFRMTSLSTTSERNHFQSETMSTIRL